jgi:hypothetical protein
MDKEYLGDSYDLVKRFLCEALAPIARLYAYPDFVPPGLRDAYTTLTTIPILDAARREGRFGLLLDPDTGIPLPTQKLVGATGRHASLPFIVQLNNDLGPEYIVCYDQSYHRKHELGREAQREAKMKFLRKNGLSSFYYVSHAPFLLVAQQPLVLDSILRRLILLGIPEDRLEYRDHLPA